MVFKNKPATWTKDDYLAEWKADLCAVVASLVLETFNPLCVVHRMAHLFSGEWGGGEGSVRPERMHTGHRRTHTTYHTPPPLPKPRGGSTKRRDSSCAGD